MMYILRYMKFFSMAEARAKLAKIIDSAEHDHERVVITRNGEPAAILLGIDDYEFMMDEIDIYSDPTLKRELDEADAELAAGRWMSLEEVIEVNEKRLKGIEVTEAEIEAMVNKGKLPGADELS